MCFASFLLLKLFISMSISSKPPTNTRAKNTQEKMHQIEKIQSNQGEEEFIDIEVTPFSNSSNTSSPQSSREFEFQMTSSSSSSSHLKEATTADELFCNGKLLPLHLPPRLQMVQNLLQNSIITQNQGFEVNQRAEPSGSFTAPPTISNTPIESCNISPVESCRVSCELNPDEYFFNWSTDATSFFSGGANHDAHLSKKAWSKKIRLIKQSALTQKLKSSRAYLKSLFLRSACSDEANCSKPSEESESWNVAKAKEYVSKYIKLVKKNPFGEMEKDSSSCTMKSILHKEMDDQVSFTCHRKSFSGAIKRHCSSKCYTSSSASSGSSSSCSSSSSSFSLKNSVGVCEVKMLKRSISANSEVENSIQGAIAHCKKSQMKENSEIRPCLVSSASKVAACGGDNRRRPEISRI